MNQSSNPLKIDMD